mmetsp:Transcript_61248/g.109249  ORF Transcript_61248/g.109249 Transcript_61248/m.109249 type:complete len:117 (+) Transcript_61248:134-484(+)
MANMRNACGSWTTIEHRGTKSPSPKFHWGTSSTLPPTRTRACTCILKPVSESPTSRQTQAGRRPSSCIWQLTGDGGQRAPGCTVSLHGLGMQTEPPGTPLWGQIRGPRKSLNLPSC